MMLLLFRNPLLLPLLLVPSQCGAFTGPRIKLLRAAPLQSLSLNRGSSVFRPLPPRKTPNINEDEFDLSKRPPAQKHTAPAHSTLPYYNWIDREGECGASNNMNPLSNTSYRPVTSSSYLPTYRGDVTIRNERP